MADHDLDTDRRRRRGRVPAYHWLAFALLFIAVLQGLWLHGHPRFTLAILVAIPPASLIACIPQRLFGAETRRFFQYVGALSGVMWLLYRHEQGATLDLALVEACAVIGLSFAFTPKPEEYGYLFLIIAMLIGYGAVVPPRGIYVKLLVPALVLCLFYTYTTRSMSLARGAFAGMNQAGIGASWRVWAAHAVLVGAAWIGIFSVFPAVGREGVGLVAVAFHTRNRQLLPPRFEHWITSREVRRGDSGTRAIDGTRNPMQSRDSEIRMSGDHGVSEMDGSGGGMPGQDLVMRIRSPVKLYWVARLYDVYDGRKWTTGKARRRRKNHRAAASLPAPIYPCRRVVPQTITIEKWLSPTLFSAYQPERAAMIPYANQSPLTLTSAGLRLKQAQFYPALPFTYTVSSYLGGHLSGDSNATLRVWTETLPREHFLKLPDGRISDRLRERAAAIVNAADSDEMKARSLRDYLRGNFTYKLQCRPVPEGRETVDFFLFELKEGHCEYYAAALAVLCRLNGIPARVATGFSPGDYNTATDSFEVYEYHAHAWTQVFLPGEGWVTLDGVPPAQVPSRTSPMIFGSIRDPFTDEWRVTPPEMTQQARKYTARTPRPSALPTTVRKGWKPAGPSRLARLMMNLPTNKEELKETVEKMRGTDGKTGKEETAPTPNRVAVAYIRMTTTLKAMLARILTTCRTVCNAIRVGHLVAGLATAVLIVAALVLWPLVRRRIDFHRQLRRCEATFRHARDACRHDPDACIAHCYAVLRELLDLCGWPRRDNMDLFDYGATLRLIDRDMCRNVLGVFYIYSQQQYSPARPTVNDAKTAFDRCLAARRFLLHKLGRPVDEPTPGTGA